MEQELGPLVRIIEPHLVNMRPSGNDNVSASCPFPDHSDRGPSFAINILNGLWMCHGCHRSGSFRTLLRHLGYSHRQVTGLVAPVQAQLDHYKERRDRRQRTRFRRGNPLKSKIVLEETLLGVYDWLPLDLVGPGKFDPVLLHELDIGFDKRKNRITFPIRDTLGNLVGLSGRATDPWEKDRYKVYIGGRTEKGEYKEGDFGPEFDEWFKEYQRTFPQKERVDQYTVNSHDHLWNGHRVYARRIVGDSREPLYVVEGYKACIWMIQNGYPNTVALMGSYATLKQIDLLCLLAGGSIVLLMDNDEAGLKASYGVGRRLTDRHRRVEVCSYYPSWAEEPDDLNALGLGKTIESRKVFTKWLLEDQDDAALDAH